VTPTYDRFVATEPPATPWVFPSLEDAEPEGPVAIGGDLEPGTLLSAYRSGLFPMPVGRRGRLGWWSPDPRAVLPVEGFHRSRSLQRSMRHFELRVDTAFESVVRACGDPRRPHGWITPEIVEAYVRLHDLGWAHSIEDVAGRPVGRRSLRRGHRGRSSPASPCSTTRPTRRRPAVAGLAALMTGTPHALVDVQWSTPHLASLGVIELERADYLDRLRVAVHEPGPPALRG
jgi:leucyl/phenylalanyl-tRNA--protein transferase